jgi:signal transduction histidine kinase
MATANSGTSPRTDAADAGASANMTPPAKRATVKRTSRRQVDILHHMAHEQRTQLHIILGFTQLLLDPEKSGNLTTEQARYVERISTAAHTLEAMIATLLEMTAIDAGQIHLQWASVAPVDLIRDVCEQMEALATEKHMKFEMAVAPEVPAVAVDRPRIQQVLFNLMGNAIKFAPAGSAITIGAQPGEGQSVDFFVRDHGPGIPKRYQAAIFKPFVQVAPDPTHKQQGSGLGLAIARQLVQLHGGRIWVQSDARRGGSTFWVQLPRGVPA